MTLQKYILRQLVIAFTFTLAIISFAGVLVMAMGRLQRNMDIGLGLIAQALPMFALFGSLFTIPLSLLIATVLTFGQMSANNEILALQAAGIPLRRFARGTILLALMLSCFTVYLNLELVPFAHFKMRSLFIQKLYNRFLLAPPRGPVHRELGTVDFSYQSHEPTTGQFHHIEIRLFGKYHDERGFRRYRVEDEYLAETGRIEQDKKTGSFFMDLRNVRHFHHKRIGLNQYEPEVLKIGQQRIKLLDAEKRAQVQPAPKDLRFGELLNDLTLARYQQLLFTYPPEDGWTMERGATLAARYQNKDFSLTDKQLRFIHVWPDWQRALDTYGDMKTSERKMLLGGRPERDFQTELHRRFSNGIAPLLLALVGILLGVTLSKGSRMAGLGASLPVGLIYFVTSFYGQNLGVEGTIPPWVGGWLGSGALLLVSVALLFFRRI